MAMVYDWGTHGAKGREQRRLGTSGATHQSEHTVGYAVLAQGTGLDRGGSPEARALENHAPAYQEMLGPHRNHIGTGSGGWDPTVGFSSGSYRDAQRTAITDGRVSDAVQLNQLAYAFDPEFRAGVPTANGQKANDSFHLMVNHMHGLTYATPHGNVTAPVDAHQQAEMHLSRIVAEGRGEGPGGFPSYDQEAAVRAACGIPFGGGGGAAAMEEE